MGRVGLRRRLEVSRIVTDGCSGWGKLVGVRIHPMRAVEMTLTGDLGMLVTLPPTLAGMVPTVLIMLTFLIMWLKMVQF